jgi:hypothetical protein
MVLCALIAAFSDAVHIRMWCAGTAQSGQHAEADDASRPERRFVRPQVGTRTDADDDHEEYKADRTDSVQRLEGERLEEGRGLTAA